MLDLRTMGIRWETKVSNGVCNVSFDRKDIQMNKLYVSCLEGIVHVFDLRTFNSRSGFAGNTKRISDSTVWGLHPLPQDRELMAATTGDGSFILFNHEYPTERRVKDSDGQDVGVAGDLHEIAKQEKLSSQPIISFDWHKEKRGLCVCTSLDQTVRILYCLGL